MAALGPLENTRVLVCDNRWPFSRWLVIIWWPPGEYLAGSWRPLNNNCQSISLPDGQYVAIFHAKSKFSQKMQIQGQRSRLLWLGWSKKPAPLSYIHIDFNNSWLPILFAMLFHWMRGDLQSVYWPLENGWSHLINVSCRFKADLLESLMRTFGLLVVSICSLEFRWVV